MKAKDCNGCSERQGPGGVGWCRMFRLRPQGRCGKYTDDAEHNDTRNSPRGGVTASNRNTVFIRLPFTACVACGYANGLMNN